MPIKKVLANHIGQRYPVKVWTEDFGLNTAEQLVNTASLPFIHKHVAGMPDVHQGLGATVGSVVPTKGAIIPAAVGVDIGCGMMASRLDIRADWLPDNLGAMRSAIEAAVPHGRTDHGGPNDRGAWGNIPSGTEEAWRMLSDDSRWRCLLERHPKLVSKRSVNKERHLGTLGTGNHFVEVCLDENDDVWVMLHSGSRGIGNRIGSYFIQLAKKEMERWFVSLPDKDLAYLPEGSEHFGYYVEAVGWAQDFAMANRELMMANTIEAVGLTLNRHLDVNETAINCHHNYVAKEHHFGANVWVTRKGAIRARKGDLGIIPGSMGQCSYIVEGLGNPDSFHSCSHGAGRTMSRGEARRTFTVEDLARQTEGVEYRKDGGVLDEIPGAYKDIDQVMENQTDLVSVVHTLKQVLCVKG